MTKLFLRYGLLLLLLLGLAAPQAQASHLLGGEMTYSYLGALGTGTTPFRYRVTVQIYVNAALTGANPSSVPDGRPQITVNFYNKSQNGALIRTVNINRQSNPLIVPPGCTSAGTPVPVRLCTYTTTVDLPVSFDGYYAAYTDGTRNRGITNLANPSDSQQQTIYMEMAPPLLPNTSPTFSDTAVVVICQGDTSLFLNNAVDAEGDRLVYSLVTPYDRLANNNVFTPPPVAVQYAAGYGPTTPFGTAPGNFAALNASTGLATYAVTQLGNYVVSVEVKEFRTINGQQVQVGATRREVQLVVRTCPPNNSPQFTASSVAQHLFTVEEGQTLNFTIGTTDADGNTVTLKANSVLLDGTGGYNATFGGQAGTVLPGALTGSASVVGAGGNASAAFRFTPRCGDARANPYDVAITATDQVNCNSKTIADVFQIQVTRTAAPTALSGDSVVCDASQVRTYTATGPTPAGGYNWRVQGGTIQGSATGSAIQVRWNSTGQGRVTVRNISAFGCQSDSVSRSINIRPASTLAVTASAPSICVGQSVTLTATNGTTYTWTGGTGTLPSGGSITVSPTQTTTYSVTSSDGVCTTTRTITVTVNPLPQANVGATATPSVCSGESIILGAAPVAGLTYQWSPATGLSSTTVANPTLTLTNASGNSIAQTYTLTVTTTSTGCTSTGTVTVSVKPGATANAGTAPTFCSGESAQLGTAAVTGLTYQWSPATGLSSATVAQPTVTLTNTTGAPITQTYTVTATTALGCQATSQVVVTVNPLIEALPGNNVAICSGASSQLGAAAVTGLTYQWSPATGLSSATVANPTVTLTNTTGAPITQTYTLTTTSTSTTCSGTATVTVTVNPRPQVNSPGTPITCSGTAIVLNGATATPGVTYAWTSATLSDLNNPNSPTPVALVTNTGTAPIVRTYTLTATNPAAVGGCTSTTVFTLTVNPAPIVPPGTTVTVCSGSTPPQLGAAPQPGYTYQWVPATGLSSATVANPTYIQTLAPGAGPLITTYTLTATTPQGCAGFSQTTVTLNPAARAVAGNDTTVCTGNIARIGRPAVAGYTYQWSPATGLSSATVANPTVTLPNPSTTALLTQRYILTVRNSFDCQDRDTVVVTVNPTVLVTPGASPRSVCSGDPITLGAPAVAGYTYQWSPATGLSSATVANPVFNQTLAPGSAPLTITYTLTATSPQGCPATAQVVVTLNPGVDVQAGPDVAICAGKSTRLGTPARTGYQYQWTPATNLSSATAAQPTFSTPLNSAAQTLRYVLRATTLQGCSLTDTVVVTVNPRPANDSIQGTASVCPTVQGVAYSIRNPRNTAYQWIVNGGTIASGQGTPSITVNWGAASSTANVRAFQLNAATGCSSDTVTFPVRINSILLTQKPTGPLRVCQADGPYTYQTLLTAGSVYGWQIIGGTQVSTSGAAVVVNWTRAGIGKIVVTESSNPAGGRCLGTSDTLFVTVLPSPAALTVNGPARVCTGTAATFQVPSIASPTYQWTLNGTVVPGVVTNSVTFPTLAPGPYTLSVVATSSGGCASPAATRTFTVDPLPGAPTVTGPRSVCPEGLTGVTYSIGSASSTSTYQWTVVGGTVASGQGTGTVQVNFSATATTRSVAVTETSQFGCAGPATTIILPLDNATVALNAASVDQTTDRKITLALSVADRTNNAGQVRILRRNAGSTAAFAQVATVANAATSYDDTSADADATAYEYRLELLNSCGTVLNSANHTTMRLEVTGTQAGAGRAQDAVSLRWNAYQGFAVQRYEVYRQADGGAAELVQTMTPTTAPDYTVSFATSAAGFDQHYRVKAVGASQVSFSNEAGRAFTNELEFYNVMTPNGDNLNDQFTIKNVALYPGNALGIFNRWGKQVYQTRNYQNTWTGDTQPAGTYYFLFTDGNGKVTKGWFEIIR
ncbi:gliding motility-associated C-terminal domain-containing protein [Hymenobacter jeollabukensis]|uniref:Gliding motility-associated C-terminal domain-containing protein n=1 Tax=Hymenobacter jeollabukensis TaxID=2025313 RepID=A0A5R8WLR2_9BACT|nr:gliding motility-associated C-terminal domain-containing protein [Hymenobacter jeollabukensis]TLM89826.1 gliding motility-associated C-terminal domain-containing protein [Hymenobacter jeollabukensis]